MYIYKPGRHRQSGSTMQKSKPPSARARYDEPRAVLPGYPAQPFKEIAEVEAYVSGDKIACLICGKYYKVPLIHVARIHELDEAEYRIRFNIPARFSLAGDATKDKHRANYANVADRLLEGVVERTKGRKQKRVRAPCEFGRQQFIKNLEKIAPRRRIGPPRDKNELARIARHRVLPGFPIAPRPFTLDEIRDYFSGDTITCLLCGQERKRLSYSHLRGIHGMTEDEYRERYGLPWGRGLTCAGTHERYQQATNRRIEQGFKPPSTPENRAIAREASRRQRAQPFQAELSRAALAKVNATPQAGYPVQESIARLFELIEAGHTPSEIEKMPDMPGGSWFEEHLTAEDKARRRELVHAQSFEYQARAQFGFSEAFYEKIRQMRAQGLSDKKIAKALGVSTMTVHRNRTARGIA